MNALSIKIDTTLTKRMIIPLYSGGDNHPYVIKLWVVLAVQWVLYWQ